MSIQFSTHNYCNSNKYYPNFSGARDINLKYIYDKRLRLLPQRMRVKVANAVENNGDIFEPLRDIHLRTYAPLLECKTLGKAQNMFYEFREVLPANVVIQHKSPNIKKIMESVKLEDLSLVLLKERWGNLKTLSSTDETLNKKIAQKTKDYNAAHRAYVIQRNRELSAKNKELNRQISQMAWDRLSHIKEAMSKLASETTGPERFAAFWEKYPEYAKEYAQMKKIVAQELRESRHQ